MRGRDGMNKKMHRIVSCNLYIVIIGAVLFLAGCSTVRQQDSFLRDNIDLGYVRTIAVLPILNNSKDEFAPERVRDVLVTQILAMGLFDVVDKGMVDGMLLEEAIDPTKPFDRQIIKRIGQRLHVQAVMVGTVDFASETRRGSIVYPELTVTIRLLEVESGVIIWQASGHGSGDSLLRRLFGQANIDSYKTTLDLITSLLVTIPRDGATTK